MAQYKITVDSQTLHQLFLTKSKDSGVSALLESVLNQILKAEATEQLQAEPYERTDERQGYRNGSYPHMLTTRVGPLTLRVPFSAMVSSQLRCLPATREASKPRS